MSLGRPSASRATAVISAASSVPRTNHGWWRRPVTASAARRGSKASFVALMGFIVISLTAPQNFVPALAPLRIALLTAVVAILALLIERFAHGRPLLTWSRETWAAAGLAGWAIASVAYSYWPGGSALELLEYFKALVAFWLLGTVVDTRSRIRVAAWTLGLASLPLAFAGIKNFRSGVFLSGASHVAVQRIIGYDAPLTENPNDLALMLNLILPLTVALFLITRGRGGRLLLAGAALISVIAVVLTFSRAGFLTLATTGTLYCWRLLMRPGRGWVVAVAVMALAAVPLLPASYLARLGTITSVDSDPTGSAQERWTDTVAAAKFLVAHPIVGAGVGMNVLALNEERGPTWKLVHNVYLELGVDLGLPGLILFLVLLLGTIRSVGRVRRAVTGDAALRDLFHLAEGLQISLIAFAVAALFHPVPYDFYFYFIAGLAVALKGVYEARPPGTGRGPGRT